eukprot:ANDGO_06107.mRNA.1 Phosphatidylinositol 4-kinase alpha 1
MDLLKEFTLCISNSHTALDPAPETPHFAVFKSVVDSLHGSRSLESLAACLESIALFVKTTDSVSEKSRGLSLLHDFLKSHMDLQFEAFAANQDTIAAAVLQSILNASSYVSSSLRAESVKVVADFMEARLAAVHNIAVQEWAGITDFVSLVGLLRALDHFATVSPQHLDLGIKPIADIVLQIVLQLDSKIVAQSVGTASTTGTKAAPSPAFAEEETTTPKTASSSTRKPKAAGRSTTTGIRNKGLGDEKRAGSSLSPNQGSLPAGADSSRRARSSENVREATTPEPVDVSKQTSVSPDAANMSSIPTSASSTTLLEKLTNPKFKHFATLLSDARIHSFGILAAVARAIGDEKMLDPVRPLTAKYMTEDYARKACGFVGEFSKSKFDSSKRYINLTARSITLSVVHAALKSAEKNEFFFSIREYLFGLILPSRCPSFLKNNIPTSGGSYLLRHCIESLSLLYSIAENQNASKAIDVLFHFLTDAGSFLINHSQEYLLRDAALDCMAQLCRREVGRTGSTASISHLLGDFNILLQGMTSSLNSALKIGADSMTVESENGRLTNLILALGRVGTFCQEVAFVDLVIPSLIDTFSLLPYPNPIYLIVWEQLVDLASSRVGSNSFREVIDLLFSIFEKFEESNAEALSSLFACLLSLAKRISNPDNAWMLFLRTLKHTHRLAFLAFGKESDAFASRSGLIRQFGDFLPAISVLLDRSSIRDHLEVDEPSMKLFRRFWFYFVLSGFGSSGSWIDEWRDALVNIPAKSPPLALRNAYNYVEVEAEINALVRGKPDASLQERLRLEVAALHSTCRTVASKLSFADCLYLLSVYHLERIRTMSVRNYRVLVYLEDISLTEKGDLYRCFEVICDTLFTGLLEILTDAEASLLAQLFILNFCHSMRNVRRLSRNLLVQLSRKYASVLWNVECVGVMLSLLQLVADAVDNNDAGPLSYNARSLNMTVNISESVLERKDLLERLSTLALRWISSAATLAPLSIQNVVDSYLLRCSDFSTVTSTAAFSVALRALDRRPASTGSPQNQVLDAPASPTHEDAIGRQRIQSLFSKMHLSGEFLHSLDLSQGTYYRESILPNIRQCLIGATSPYQLGAAINRAASYIMNVQLDWELLKLMTVRVFNMPCAEVAKSAVVAWGWLLTSANGDLEGGLLGTMLLCWENSIANRVGLFGPSQPSSELTFHDRFVNFVYERFIVAAEKDEEFCRLFFHFVSVSLADEVIENMCTKVYSRPCRFRLLSMALRVMHSKFVQQGSVLLRQIIRCALLWFRAPPAWLDILNADNVYEQAMLLRSVTHQFEVEQSVLRKQFAKTVSTGAKNVSGRQVLSTDQDDVRSTSSQQTRALSASGSLKEQRVDTATLTSVNTLSFAEGELRELMGRLDVVILLLSHESERINVWWNPQSEKNKDLNTLSVPSTSAGVTVSSPTIGVSGVSVVRTTATFTRESWRSHLEYAWSLSPQIAYNLYSRFRSPLLRTELEEMTRRFAPQLTHVSEAVPFLIIQRAVDEDYSELTLLSHWISVSLEIVIPMFSESFMQHPNVRRYVLRCLSDSSPDDIVFFLPQIIQSLRYEVEHEVSNVLRLLARRDRYFCHQLLWALRTEIRDSPMSAARMARDVQVDMTLSNICKALFESIIYAFTGDELSFYESEFGFFDDLIQISGRLREFEKPQRRQVLLDEVARVPMRPKIYLPSNPKVRVVGIRKEKCMPMQSAAKSPILVPFEVVEEGELTSIPGSNAAAGSLPRDKEESNNESKGEDALVRSQGAASSTIKACILKMGDDCRQDQLALQIISLFKRIFDDAGLPLYLFPYRVITVAHGCGIIECVPNTTSRDQLGHQVEGSLYDYFVQKHGHKDSIAFQRARRNFVQSMAAYSVISFILNIKDRHNGNILISEEGHVIHIDFGFIYDISPGGDINFESSPFKLTTEMVAVLGMGIEEKKKRVYSEPYSDFVDGVIRGFLSARRHMDIFVALTALMLNSGLPCFKPDTMKNLRARFAPELSERDAAMFMANKVDESFENIRTVLYDQFQRLAEGIQC